MLLGLEGGPFALKIRLDMTKEDVKVIAETKENLTVEVTNPDGTTDTKTISM